MADLITFSASLGLALGVAYIAITYMLSFFFMSEKLKAYSKVELGELGMSALLVLIILWSLANQAAVMRGLTGQAITDPVAYVQEQIYTQTELPLLNLYDGMVRSSMHLSKIVGFNYNYQTPSVLVIPTHSRSPGAGAGALQMELMAGIDTVQLNILLTASIKLAYVFLYFVMQQFLIPLGLIMRFIPPTRKIGGVLLGIGLAVYFVFPAAVYWSTTLLPLSSGIDSSKLILDPGTPPTSDAVCSPIFAAIFNLGDIPAILISWLLSLWGVPIGLEGQYDPPLPIGGAPGVSIGSLYVLQVVLWALRFLFNISISNSLEASALNVDADAIITRAYEPLINYILPMAVERVLTAILCAIIQMATTIVMARQFAQLLGAEGQIYGLSRLV